MSIPFAPFKREDHIYSNPAFAEFLKDAVRAFNGSPVAPMPPPSFTGSGVYALYCTAVKGPYAKFGKEINRLEYKVPIYVGKAVPPGWRQSRQLDGTADKSTSLYSRLCKHSHSIEQGKGLSLSDFACRFLHLSTSEQTLATKITDFMVALYKPLWNTIIRGFSRCNFTNSTEQTYHTNWDVMHNGKLPSTNERKRILSKIYSYLNRTAKVFAA